MDILESLMYLSVITIPCNEQTEYRFRSVTMLKLGFVQIKYLK